MNQEYNPRHRAEHSAAAPQPESSRGTPRDPASDTYVRHVIEHAPTPKAGAVIAEIYARHGTPFALYLALDGVDKYVRDYGPASQSASPEQIEIDFTSCYYGHYPDPEALIEDTIESFDWRAETNRLLRDHPELRQFLVFDRDAIYGFVSDYYEIVRTDDGLYVFERWP